MENFTREDARKLREDLKIKGIKETINNMVNRLRDCADTIQKLGNEFPERKGAVSTIMNTLANMNGNLRADLLVSELVELVEIQNMKEE